MALKSRPELPGKEHPRRWAPVVKAGAPGGLPGLNAAKLQSRHAPMAAISDRTLNLGTEHAFIVLAEVNRLIAEGRPIISFAIGQPDFITPGNIREAAKRAMDAGHTGYTASAGIPELRAAVAAFLTRTRGISVSEAHVTVGNGAK
ncbi:MAG: aminotransferase class I/II-fold pyridoxal phosphate-dependent enzyme, partial [SAR324 cluster bacterium]|nr:aminotransferase class I/II-fold pyridoxal phosphate-dependent enzyme [SAR324 cluster bacterium]